MSVIIRSGKKQWSGKEFSNEPAKVYGSFDDAVTALNSYHFYKYDDVKHEFVPCTKMQKIEFVFLSPMKWEILFRQGKIRL